MERPFISIDESIDESIDDTAECAACEAYSAYLVEVDTVGLPYLSYEEFVADFALPVRTAVVELPEEDDIAW